MITILRFLKRIWLVSFLRRLLIAFRHYYNPFKIIGWAVRSDEYTNFTYEIKDNNRKQLAHLLSNTFNVPVRQVYGYMDECKIPGIARKIGWYAMVRILKPEVVVECGIDRGLGGSVLCQALVRNWHEGHGRGVYYGIDINPQAGGMVKSKYGHLWTIDVNILIGDSLEVIGGIDQIDLFIHDSSHGEREMKEYELLNLSENAVILSNNAHCDDTLLRFSEQHNRRFVHFREQPKDHWSPGGGIGISYTAFKNEEG